MTKTIHGRIHGKTIELDEDLGVAAGQEVEVQVTVVQTARKWGEGSADRGRSRRRYRVGWHHGADLSGPQGEQGSPDGAGMTHLLDTNICSAHMRRPGGLAHRFFQHAGGRRFPPLSFQNFTRERTSTLTPTAFWLLLPTCSRRSWFSTSIRHAPSVRQGQGRVAHKGCIYSRHGPDDCGRGPGPQFDPCDKQHG